ncbi:deoxyguanosinetriphosphate triphosphohydrolase [Bacillus sp. JCM 19045]|nr:deoxyguanosinetriphosphate triphosphohydrolase [Bacillus sp. JCM 19045]
MLNEPLYPSQSPLPWETALFQTSFVKRLKHLAHFGAGSFVSPVTHSRFEHTVGVWKLAVHFFPNNHLLRAASILHDIGHLPFSHSVERALSFDHHQLTKSYIHHQEISSILEQNNLSAETVCHYLDQDTPLTGSKNVLGLDHLDSFFRDTYMAGSVEELPRNIINRLTCSADGIAASEEDIDQLMQIIFANNRLIHSPALRAADYLLSESVRLHWQEAHSSFAFLIDAQVIAELLQSKNKQVTEMIHTLLYQPKPLVISTSISGNGFVIPKGKIYAKQPLVNQTPYCNSESGRAFQQKLSQLAQEYELVLT